MYSEFENLNNNSRVWVYLSNRKFTPPELIDLDIKLKQFVEQWTAHKKDLAASFTIYDGIAIVLAVDVSHNDASGCSIDASVRVMKEIEQAYDVELFNRNIVAYKANEHFVVTGLDDFKSKVESGQLNSNTLVLNTLVNTKEEFNTTFVIPLNTSWHQQLI